MAPRLRIRFGRRTVHLALPLIFVTSMLCYLLFSPSSSSLYDPKTSAVYTPPDQPPNRMILNSIIVPTYKERANLRPLTERIFKAVHDPTTTELVIVDDDSKDGTTEEAAQLKEDGYEVVLLERKGKKEKGLSSAVLRGFERARGTNLIVMDADLQHPPETIQALLDALSSEAPLALATRYGKGVSMSTGWPLYRRIISWGARVLSKPLTSATDPMTGFFGITKDHFRQSRPINSSGFKVALELLLKTPSSKIAEVPYSFGLRRTGASKLSSSIMLRYVGQLLTLYSFFYGPFFHLFLGLIVGASIVFFEKVVLRLRRMKGNGPMLVSSNQERKPLYIPGGSRNGMRSFGTPDKNGKRMM